MKLGEVCVCGWGGVCVGGEGGGWGGVWHSCFCLLEQGQDSGLKDQAEYKGLNWNRVWSYIQ